MIKTYEELKIEIERLKLRIDTEWTINSGLLKINENYRKELVQLRELVRYFEIQGAK